jgi:uncharacterized protein with PIN domain
MKLTTEVTVNPFDNPVDYNSKVMCLGSCFAEHLSKKLDYYKFRYTSNPFGILFHPQAILNVVEKSLSDEIFTSDDVFLFNEKWQSFYSHSRLTRISETETLAVLNSAKEDLKKAIKESTHIIITLGTSFVYKHLTSGQLVANCHKVPQHEFEKQLTSVIDHQDILTRLIKLCREVNSEVNFIFTVSPVRHIKNGIVENQRSKAHILVALHQVLEKEPNSTYFPSYELMMDEFRDYRFYERDLIHPNELAVDIIWEKFKMNFISERIYPDLIKVDKLQKSIGHRQIESQGEAFEKLKAYQYKFKKELTKKYPFMRFPKL